MEDTCIHLLQNYITLLLLPIVSVHLCKAYRLTRLIKNIFRSKFKLFDSNVWFILAITLPLLKVNVLPKTNYIPIPEAIQTK